MNKELFKKTAMGGIISNPVFVLVLGMCPTLALSNTIENAFWLGLATMFVLLCSNVLISLLRKVIPDKVRIACFIVVIATFATVVDMLLGRFLPEELYASLSVGIKLIIVNCIILARAESYASNNSVGYSAIDAASMGLGFFAAIMLLAGFRTIMSEYVGISIFSETTGGFLALAILMAAFNFVFGIIERRKKPHAAILEEAA